MTISTAKDSSIQRTLAGHFKLVRSFSERLCETLEPEDCCIQSMPDASPVRWHLAHTTWFFETFLLSQWPGYQASRSEYRELFNSYYNAIGKQFPRDRRGVLSRPTVSEVMQYRREVDERMIERLDGEDSSLSPEFAALVELGLNHEQQHQELMLTDIKHAFSCNPLYPMYRPGNLDTGPPATNQWIRFEEGVREIGHADSGFAYDNESPRHRVFLEDFCLSSRLVTNGEYLDFIADEGYSRPELWLADGWKQVEAGGWDAPLYWHHVDQQWYEFTLAGQQPLDPGHPVCHLSYYEADAFARWASARLPTEAEWEVASANVPLAGRWADSRLDDGSAIHPTRSMPEDAHADSLAEQMFAVAWQWTSSPYTAYPGFRPAPGAVGEYNGKFMCNQFVLRGGSCATPSHHVRRSYRNFFPPQARWQFAGIRLAKDSAAL